MPLQFTICILTANSIFPPPFFRAAPTDGASRRVEREPLPLQEPRGRLRQGPRRNKHTEGRGHWVLDGSF